MDVLPNEFSLNWPRGMRFSTEGTYIATSTDGARETTVWHADEGVALFTVVGEQPVIHEGTNRLYAFDDVGGVVRVYAVEGAVPGTERADDLGPADHVNGTPFALGDEYGAFVSIQDFFRGAYRFFDLTTGRLLDHQVQAFPYLVREPEALPDGRFLVSPDQLTVLAVRPQNGAEELVHGCVADSPGDALDRGVDLMCVDAGGVPQLTHVSVSLNGEQVLFSDEDRATAEITWTVANADTFAVLGAEEPLPGFNPVTFTPDWFLLSDAQREVTIVDRISRAILWEGEVPGAVEISPSRRTAAVSGTDGRLEVVDLSSLESRIHDFGFGHLRAAAFGPGDRLIAVADLEALRIIDLASGQVLHTRRIGRVSDVHWFDDESVLIGTFPGEWVRLSLDNDEIVAEAAAGLLRTFTDQECAAYRIDPCPSLEELRGG